MGIFRRIAIFPQYFRTLNSTAPHVGICFSSTKSIVPQEHIVKLIPGRIASLKQHIMWMAIGKVYLTLTTT